MDKLLELLAKFGKDEIADVVCKGRLPSHEACKEILYQTDGEFLYINGAILNKGQGKQTLHCPRCGAKSEWKRNPKFRSGKISEPKFQSRF